MDLKQRKLSKSEWESIEVPVSADEVEVLNLIMRGFSDVNLKYNKHNSLLTYLKIEKSDDMEDYLYNTYFAGKIGDLITVSRKHYKNLNGWSAISFVRYIYKNLCWGPKSRYGEIRLW